MRHRGSRLGLSAPGKHGLLMPGLEGNTSRNYRRRRPSLLRRSLAKLVDIGFIALFSIGSFSGVAIDRKRRSEQKLPPPFRQIDFLALIPMRTSVIRFHGTCDSVYAAMGCRSRGAKDNRSEVVIISRCPRIFGAPDSGEEKRRWYRPRYPRQWRSCQGIMCHTDEGCGNVVCRFRVELAEIVAVIATAGLSGIRTFVRK